MRQTIKAIALFAALIAGPAPVIAQNLPPGTVQGRLPPIAGPVEAIPFATLASQLSLSAGLVVGPTTTVIGDFATWGNATGSALADGGTPGTLAFINGGTGVNVALAASLNATGGLVGFNGALGTPTSGVATNLTGTAASLTAGHVTTNANLTGDVTSVGNTTTLATGNAGNLNSGTLLAARMPALTGDVTTTSGTVATTIAANAVTNAKMATMGAFTIKANATGLSAVPTDVSIPALTQKASPVAGDMIMLVDSAASNALKFATVSSLASAGSVASIAGNTGAFTLSNGITNSTNDIRLNIGHLPGEPSTGNAAAGEIGEVISSVIPAGSAVGVSNGIAANVASISLPSGDWDVSGVAYTTNPRTTVITFLEIAVSPTTATLPTRAVASGVVSAGSNVLQNFGGSSGSNESIATAPVRVSLASTTTIFLVLNSTFTTSTLSAYGVIRARRMR